MGAAHAVVKGDGDLVWEAGRARLLCRRIRCRSTTAAGLAASSSCPRAGICCRASSYMWASVQTVRGCPKHCSFCSVWRTDGQEPRQRGVDLVVQEIVELRRLRIPLHRAGRRQLLPGHAQRPRARPSAARIRRGSTSSSALRANASS